MQSTPIQIPVGVGAGDADRAGDPVGVGLGCRVWVGLVCVAGLVCVGVLVFALDPGCGGLDVGPPAWCTRVLFGAGGQLGLMRLGPPQAGDRRLPTAGGDWPQAHTWVAARPTRTVAATAATIATIELRRLVGTRGRRCVGSSVVCSNNRISSSENWLTHCGHPQSPDVAALTLPTRHLLAMTTCSDTVAPRIFPNLVATSSPPYQVVMRH